MAAFLPARALGLAAVLALLVLCPGAAQARRKPHPPKIITTKACDALNKALLEAYFRPDLGIGGYAFTRPVPVYECSRTLVEFNESSFQDALYDLDNAGRYYKNFYSHYQVARHSSAPGLPSNIDILFEFQKLAKQSWTYVEDFYQAMSDAVGRLQDAHTNLQYSANVPASFWNPLPFVSLVVDGVPTIQVAPESLTYPIITLAASKSPFNFNASLYFGATVLSINGTPAYDYMLSWATRTSLSYRTPAQRLNTAMARFVWYNYRADNSQGDFSATYTNPKADFLNLVLMRPNSTVQEEVAVPWIARVAAGGFPFLAKQVKRRSGVADVPSSPPPGGRKPDTGPPKDDAPVPRGAATKPKPPAQVVAYGSAFRISGPDDLWPVYKLRDGKTAIIGLTEFESDSYGYFVTEFIKAFATADDENCTQVILDVRSNPGGYLEYMFGVTEALFGTDKTNKTGFSYQTAKLRLRADTKIPYLMVAANASVWDWEGWADANEVPYTSATSRDFFNPPETLQFGPKGVKGRYSRKFTDNSPRLIDVVGKIKSVLGKKKLALLSDGHCFSACGSFSFAVRARFDAKFVTIGGIPGKPLQFCGGAGSAVVFDVVQTFAQAFPPSVFQRPDAPGQFASSRITLGMPFTTAQQADVPVFLDFAPLNGDLVLNYSQKTIDDPFSIWVEAAQVFK